MRLLILLLLVTTVYGGTILSERNDHYTVHENGGQRLYENKTITYRCTEVDIGVTRQFNIEKPDGTTSSIEVVCGRPKYTYSVSPVGKVLAKGRLVVVPACTVRDTSKFNQSERDILSRLPPTAQAPSRRRLLFDVGTSLCPACKGAEWVYSKLTDGGDDDEDPPGLPDDWDDNLNDLIRNHEDMAGLRTNLSNARQKFRDSLQNVTNFQSALLVNLTKQDGRITDVLEAAKKRDAILEKRIESNEKWINTTATDMINLRRTTGESITNLTLSQIQQEAELQILSLQLNETVRNVVEGLTKVSKDATTAVNELRDQGDQRHWEVVKKINALAGLQRDSTALMIKIAERRVMKRMITRRVHELMTFNLTAEETGFFLDQGKVGAALYGENWYIEIDKVQILRAVDDGGPKLYATDFSVRCNVNYLMKTDAAWQTIDDIFNQIGPYESCSIENHECTCYIVRTDTTCPTTELHLVDTNFTSTVDTLNDTYCTGNIVNIGDDIIRSAQSFALNLTSICENINPLPGHKIIVTSNYLGRKIAVDNDLTVCDVMSNFSRIMNPLYDSFTWIYAMVQMMLLNQVKVWSSVDTISDYIDGVIPSGLSFISTDFTRAGGQDASCLTAGFMAFEPETIPVFKLIPVSTSTSVTVTIDGEIVHKTYDVNLDIGLNFLLPSDYIMISPNNDTWVYDVPDEDISMSPAAPARQGKVTYTLMNNDDDITYEAWTDKYGVTFDHFEASNVPDIYKRPLVSGKCTGQPLAHTGSYCTLLENYIVTDSPGGNGRQFQPRDATYDVVIRNLPTGKITAGTISTCPIVETDMIASDATKITLYNPSNFNIIVYVDIKGSCPQLIENIVIAPQETNRILAKTCLANPIQSVDVYKFDGSLSICKSGINVTSDPAKFYVDENRVDSPYVLRTSIQKSFDNTAGFVRIMNIAIQMMEDTLINVISSQISMGVPLSIDAWGRFANFSKQIREAAANKTADVAKQIAADYDTSGLDELRANITAKIEEQRKATAAANLQFEAALNNLRNNQPNITGLQESLNYLLNDLHNSSQKWVDLENNMTTLQVEAFANVIQGFKDVATYVDDVNAYLETLGGGNFLFGLGGVFKGLAGGGIGIASGIWGAGEDLVEGLPGAGDYLWNGFKDAVKAVVDEGKGLLDDLLGGFANTFRDLMLLCLIPLAIFILYSICKNGVKGNPHVSFSEGDRFGQVLHHEKSPEEAAAEALGVSVDDLTIPDIPAGTPTHMRYQRIMHANKGLDVKMARKEEAKRRAQKHGHRKHHGHEYTHVDEPEMSESGSEYSD